MVSNEEIIYNLFVNLPSPCMDKVDPLGHYGDLFAPLHGSEPIEGLVTPLYQYQRAAVAQMLHQELYPPGSVPILGELPLDTYPPELRSEPIGCLNDCGKHHYSPVVNPLPASIETTADTTTVRTRGGILAEDPRTGKILEFLTLILLTKDQIACPTALDMPFTKTACGLTYRHYLDHSLLSPYNYPGRNPSHNGSKSAGSRSYEYKMTNEMNKVKYSCLPGEGIVPPLRYLALREMVHRPRFTRTALRCWLPPDLRKLMLFLGFCYVEDRESAAAYFASPEKPISESMQQHHQDLALFTKNTPDIPVFKANLALVSSQGPTMWKRVDKSAQMSSRYHKLCPQIPTHLSRTTLVILTETYINTWVLEIEKHIVPGTLKYITIQGNSDPSLAELLECDLVFLSLPHLESAYNGFLRKAELWEKDRTIYHATSPHKPISQCLNVKDKDIPPIYRILWKRVIIKDCKFTRDIYHRRQNDCLDGLLSERRWLCLIPDSLVLEQSSHRSWLTHFSPSSTHGMSDSLSTKDLDMYFTYFLKLHPLSFNDPRKRVGALLDKNMCRNGNRSLLHWLLTTYVVRNRSEVVRREISLPPLTKRTVDLDCGHYELHSYNFVLAQVIAHMIWDEYKCDRGLLSSPLRRRYRHDYLLKRSSLWPTPSVFAATRELNRMIYDFVKNEVEGPGNSRMRPEEIDLLRQCQYWMELGRHYESYRPHREFNALRYYVDCWPESSPVALTIPMKPGPVLLRKLRCSHEADKQTVIAEQSLCHPSTLLVMFLYGKEVISLTRQLQEFYKRTEDVSPEVNTTSNISIDDKRNHGTTCYSALSDVSPDSLETTMESHHVMKSLAIRGCSSAKLTYLANQLRSYTPYEKVVVYVNSMADMVCVTQFLSVIGVQSVTWPSGEEFDGQYVEGYKLSGCSDRTRYDVIVEFTTNDNCRALVIPTRAAMYGIDLTVASRVYFFSPVWHEVIEAQAIQQVHHMGQTRAVHVETLVLRNTLEDVVWNFKGKPFPKLVLKTCILRAEQDYVVFNGCEFIIPPWKDAMRADDLLDEYEDEVAGQRVAPTGKGEDTKKTTVDALSTQSSTSNNNHFPRPEFLFDEPIPLLSLQL